MVLLSRTENLIWTQHSLHKLRQYNLSVSRIKRVLRHPKRKEVGVAPDTVAVMQPAGTPKHPYEIWAMYQQKLKVKSEKSRLRQGFGGQVKVKNDGRITIISAWRYPGVSPIHEPPPIPEEVWEILNKN